MYVGSNYECNNVEILLYEKICLLMQSVTQDLSKVFEWSLMADGGYVAIIKGQFCHFCMYFGYLLSTYGKFY